MKRLLAVILSVMLIGALILSGCGQSAPRTPQPTTSIPAYHPTTTVPTTTRPARPYPTVQPTIIVTVPPGQNQWGGPATTYPTAPNEGNIGLSTGGAKDIANFRENIQYNYLPLPTDVTYEGLFFDYYFDTGANEPTDKLFSPSYSYAVTRDPLSQRTEYYLSVGLDSGLKESELAIWIADNFAIFKVPEYGNLIGSEGRNLE